MTLAPGTRLGHYQIVSPLGAGGMGEVYKAHDARLGRDVAIKTLPPAFASDPDRLARFEREAKLLASLRHENVAGIHGLEEVEGHRYLILEYVEGESLAARLSRGSLPVDEALEVGRQIAAGVEAAHESGVVHRDLKPGNVMLTPAGVVKVLDFGLAKSGPTAGAISDSNLSASPTMTAAMTEAGMILGTAAYMSPEQARGKPVDRRTDIWSFGCVLYECLSGRRTFEGETVPDLIARILEREPDWTALPPQVPAKARELMGRCLDKDAKKRLRDVGDARLQLEEALVEVKSSGRMAVAEADARKQARAATPFSTLLVLALGLAIGAIAGITAWNTIGPGATLRMKSKAFASATHLSVTLPVDIRFDSVRLSRDGSALICLGRPRKPEGSTEEPAPMIYTRQLDSYAVKPVPGTEGASYFLQSQADDSLFFVAPVSRGSARRRISKVPLDGSAPAIGLTDWKDNWAEMTALGNGDLIVLMDAGTSFVRIPAEGGEPVSPMKLDAGEYRGNLRMSGALPGDTGVLLNGVSYGSRGWYYRIALLDPRTGKVQFLLDDGGNASYSPTGHLLFTRGDALLAAPFDFGRLATTGPPAPILSGLWTRLAAEPADFSLAGNGTLMYRPGGTVLTERRLVTVDASGNVEPWNDERRMYMNSPAISRDGRRFATTITNAQGIDEIWVSEFDRPALRKVVSIPDADCDIGSMTPDGEAFVYYRNGRDENDGIYMQRTDGQGEPKRIIKPATPNNRVIVFPGGWSPDGTALLSFETIDGRLHLRIQRGLLASSRPVEPRPAISGFLDEFQATFSPDGQMIAFGSNDSGKPEVYVCAYHSDGTTNHPVRVSTGGGFSPHWAAGGKSLLYVAEPRRLMSVSITQTPAITAGTPAQVMDLERLRIADFSVLPDGSLLGVLTSELERDEITSENLVLNFFEQLERAQARGK